MRIGFVVFGLLLQRRRFQAFLRGGVGLMLTPLDTGNRWGLCRSLREVSGMLRRIK